MFSEKLLEYKSGKLTKDELENEWYKMMHSKPGKRTERRVFQVAWSTHPISKEIVNLRNNSPVYIKKAITVCIKYSKTWWSKTTDTYLFPSYAIALYLNSLPDRDTPIIQTVKKENAMAIYHSMEKHSGPSNFIKRIVASDQHTTLGALNGVGKKSPYATCTFSLYHSAVRPYTLGCENVFQEYLDARLPELTPMWRKTAYDNLIDFGSGKIDQEMFWEKQCMVMKMGLGLMEPTPYEYWKEKDVVRKPILGLKHPNPNAAFHFRCSPLIESWNLDSLISLLQKMIRRSCLFEATWAVCRICMFALFHMETGSPTEMWTIHPPAQAKVTNVINRLIVITAEDMYPDAKLFLDITSTLEIARKCLLGLKEPQPSDLYIQRFESLVMHLVTVVVSIIERPKQHYIGSRMYKFGKWYERSKTIVEDSVDELNKKRKQSDIRTLFKF